MARDPIKRAASREADKLRKRERRRIQKLRGQLASATSRFERRAIVARLSEAREALNALKYDRESRSYAGSLKEVSERGTGTPTAFNLKTEMRRVGQGRKSAIGLSERTARIRSKAFWVATQALWEDSPETDKLSAIYEKVKKDFSSIEEYYNYVMSQPEVKRAIHNALAIDNDNAGLIDDTDELSEAYYEADRGEIDDLGGTPVKLANLAYINAVMAYA